MRCKLSIGYWNSAIYMIILNPTITEGAVSRHFIPQAGKAAVSMQTAWQLAFNGVSKEVVI
jgi:hypothetical protein